MTTLRWGYAKHNGPSRWGELAPNALGLHQSPIVIHPADAVYDQRLQDNALKLHYTDMEACSIVNTGRSVQLNVPSAKCYVEGGPLNNKYELRQFHFHWGDVNSVGSEHVVDDKVFAAELHLVHWNCEKYKKFEDAVPSPDGLCVLTVFIEPGIEHSGMDLLTKLMADIPYAGDERTLSASFNPLCLLPKETDKYWTYRGSLTTPPCYESVIFVLFKEPVQTSPKQLESFRHLYLCAREAAGANDTSTQLVNNFRPPMPLNGRTVSASFRKFFA